MKDKVVPTITIYNLKSKCVILLLDPLIMWIKFKSKRAWKILKKGNQNIFMGMEGPM